MATLGISPDFWRHTRAFQYILEEGRQEGIEKGREDSLAQGRRRQAEALALRLLDRRCGPLDAPTRSLLERLTLKQLESLALALLDFQGPEDLARWLAGQRER